MQKLSFLPPYDVKAVIDRTLDLKIDHKCYAEATKIYKNHKDVLVESFSEFFGFLWFYAVGSP